MSPCLAPITSAHSPRFPLPPAPFLSIASTYSRSLWASRSIDCRSRSASCSAALRECDGYEITEDDVRRLAGWSATAPSESEIPFKPARVILQDFTGRAVRSSIRGDA